MFGSLGWQELLLVLAILALLFGGSRVGELGGALGRAIREFREGVRGNDEQAAPRLADDQHAGSAPSSTASRGRTGREALQAPEGTRGGDGGGEKVTKK